MQSRDYLSEYLPEAVSITPLKNHDWLNECLSLVPDYFWVMPASTGGKYHTPDDNGERGLLRHVRKCIVAAKDLFPVYRITNDELQTVICALVLHDTFKCGLPGQENTQNGRTYTDKNHPLHPRIALVPKLQSHPDDEDMIFRLIEGHYGSWSPEPQLYPRMELGMDRKEILVAFVHLCDMVASRPRFHIILEEVNA